MSRQYKILLRHIREIQRWGTTRRKRPRLVVVRSVEALFLQKSIDYTLMDVKQVSTYIQDTLRDELKKRVTTPTKEQLELQAAKVLDSFVAVSEYAALWDANQGELNISVKLRHYVPVIRMMVKV